MNTKQIAEELMDWLADHHTLWPENEDATLARIQAAIEKATEPEFYDQQKWIAQHNIADEHIYDSVGRVIAKAVYYSPAYRESRAAHASEPDLSSGRRHKKPIVEGGASAVAASGTATTAQTLLGSKQCPAPENELGDSSGDTSHVHIEHYFPKGYDPTAEPWKSIRQHHQSELNWAEQLRKQLAVEVEKVNKLNEQLAFEREKNDDLAKQIAIGLKRENKLSQRVAYLQRVIDEHHALNSRAAHLPDTEAAAELLRSVHNWFMKSAPEHYNGCGLWIDVDAFLKETASRAAHASEEESGFQLGAHFYPDPKPAHASEK